MARLFWCRVLKMLRLKHVNYLFWLCINISLFKSEGFAYVIIRPCTPNRILSHFTPLTILLICPSCLLGSSFLEELQALGQSCTPIPRKRHYSLRFLAHLLVFVANGCSDTSCPPNPDPLARLISDQGALDSLGVIVICPHLCIR